MKTSLSIALSLLILCVLAGPAVAVPLFNYYTPTGEMFMDLNGEGFYGLLIEGPAALSIDRWRDGTTQDGAVWAQQYFNGKEQWVSLNLVSPPDGVYQIATYAMGLSGADFGDVEIGSVTGAIHHTQVTVHDGTPAVPEPATALLFGLGAITLGALRRRRG